MKFYAHFGKLQEHCILIFRHNSVDGDLGTGGGGERREAGNFELVGIKTELCAAQGLDPFYCNFRDARPADIRAHPRKHLNKFLNMRLAGREAYYSLTRR